MEENYWNRSRREHETFGDSLGSGVQNKFDYSDFNTQSGEENNLTLIGISPVANATEPYVRDEFLAKIEQFVLILIFTLTILGNFLVLVGIYFRKQKMTRMYYFILHLSLADLTTAFFNVLTQLFWEFTYRFQGGSFMCKFVKYTQILGPYASSYILVMTALDRYQAICYPLSNCSWTARRSKIMLSTAWMASFLFCLPQLWIFSYQMVKPGSGSEEAIFDCWGTFIPNWGEKAYITWYCISVFIVPLAILIFAYTCITRVIWLNFSMKNAISKEERPKNRLSRGDSDDVDEGLDHTIEDNDSSRIHEKFDNKNKSSDENKIYRKSYSTREGEKFITPKHLEVSWHSKKQEAQITTLMSPNVALSNELSASLMKCQSSSSTVNNVNKDIIKNNRPNSPYYKEDEGEQYLATISPLEDNNKLLKSKQLSTPSNTLENHTVQLLTNGAVQIATDKLMPNKDDKSFSSFKTQKWKSISMSSKYNGSRHVDHKKEEVNNGDYGGSHKRLKSLKLSLLSPREKGHRMVSTKMSTSLSAKSSALSYNQPRTHSVKGISRAKIKTVKLTVTVICMYIICSTPFIAALLWSAYDPYAKEHPFFFGPTFTILTLLASLNSCANAWIVLFFNPNLLQSFVNGTCGRICPVRQLSRRPLSMNSQKRKPYNKSLLVTTNSNQMTATSVTGLSPLMNRRSQKEAINNGSPCKEQNLMELIPPATTSSRTHSLSSKNRNYPPSSDRRSRDVTIPTETSFIGI